MSLLWRVQGSTLALDILFIRVSQCQTPGINEEISAPQGGEYLAK